MKMKKIFILLLFISLISYTNNDNSSQILLSKESEIEETRLNDFFNAIRYFNNTQVMRYINGDGEENINIYSQDAYKPAFKNIEISKIEKIDINARNLKGETALLIAIEYGNNTILDELLKRDVNLDVRHPIFGKYPLNIAAYYSNYDGARLLIEKDKSLVNKVNDVDGWHPLEDAALKGNTNMVVLFLENGADPFMKDKKGYSALDLATNFGKGEIVKLLRIKMKEIRKNNK